MYCSAQFRTDAPVTNVRFVAIGWQGNGRLHRLHQDQPRLATQLRRGDRTADLGA